MKRIPSIARLYHLHSSHTRSLTAAIEFDEDEVPFRFRTYPGSPRVDLPGRDFDVGRPLGEVLRQRRSVRDFRLEPMPLALLGRLLHASFGVRGYHELGAEPIYDRAAPSAGGLYPLELYVATQAVEGLDDGFYHYDLRAHQLELRRAGLMHPQVADIALGQRMVRDSNLIVIVTAVFERTMRKYGERGYRYVWLDAGHVGQNIYLVAAAMELGAVAVGGFFDADLNHLLDLPAGEEEAIYLMCIGRPGGTEGPVSEKA
jgi:SagB-type dehydrogenase family enzyme